MKNLLCNKKTIMICVASLVMVVGQWLGKWQIPTEAWIAMASAAGIALRLGIAKVEPKEPVDKPQR